MEWGLAYVGMWFAKWIIASIVLKINAFDYVINEAIERICGDKQLLYTPLSVLQLNFYILFLDFLEFLILELLMIINIIPPIINNKNITPIIFKTFFIYISFLIIGFYIIPIFFQFFYINYWMFSLIFSYKFFTTCWINNFYWTW